MAVFFMPALLTRRGDSFGKAAGLNMSARETPHARLDIHVGPCRAHHLLRGLPGPVQCIARLGWPVRSLGFVQGHESLPRARRSSLCPMGLLRRTRISRAVSST